MPTTDDFRLILGSQKMEEEDVEKGSEMTVTRGVHSFSQVVLLFEGKKDGEKDGKICC